MLEVHNVGKSFGGVQALEGVNVSVTRRQVMGLIGPNGAGKTTLFNAIAGFLKVDQGSITLDGERIDRLPCNRVAKKGVGRTFQVTKVFHNFSVYENLLAACPDRMTIAEMIDYLQLQDLAEKPAGVLSLFDQKRVELAMALALRPKLLLMDEPTSGLNPAEKRYVTTLVNRIKQDFGPAIVLIEHDVRLALDLSDQITLLFYGKVLASGEPREVLRSEEAVKNYLGRMAI